MRVYLSFMAIMVGLTSLSASQQTRLALAPRPIPDTVYKAPMPSNVTTLGDLIASRPELSTLASVIKQAAGFSQAMATSADWSFTFFAPNNDAFNKTGQYYETFAATPKGTWWLGNLVQHHYVTNSQIKSSVFNETATRLQTSTYLFVKTQRVDGTLTLNDVSHVTEADIPITNGIVHIIDRLLDPSAQIFNSDLPPAPQAIIAGSCSNLNLPYC